MKKNHLILRTYLVLIAGLVFQGNVIWGADHAKDKGEDYFARLSCAIFSSLQGRAHSPATGSAQNISDEKKGISDQKSSAQASSEVVLVEKLKRELARVQEAIDVVQERERTFIEEANKKEKNLLEKIEEQKMNNSNLKDLLNKKEKENEEIQDRIDKLETENNLMNQSLYQLQNYKVYKINLANSTQYVDKTKFGADPWILTPDQRQGVANLPFREHPGWITCEEISEKSFFFAFKETT